jgi:DNA-directed RNA polymerase specialized sigma24 family protein
VPVRRSRDAIVRHLALARRPRLVAAARAAGAGDEAEDAVQEVLAALAAGVGSLPLEEERAEAYALTAVRRRARARASGAAPAAAVPSDPGRGPDADLEERLGVRAFTDAIRDLAPRVRAVLVLDAAGWPRAAIAARLGTSERSVKRMLDEERGAAMARARRALDGEDCTRLHTTLAAFGRGSGLPRPGGPAARHLATCPACRAALASARRTRTALESLFPPPVAAMPVAPIAPAPVVALVAKGLATALVGAAITAGSLHVADDHHHHAAPPPAPPPAASPHRETATSRLRAMVPAAAVVRIARRHRHHHHRRVPYWAAPRPPGSCTFGTLGICGAEGAPG